MRSFKKAMPTWILGTSEWLELVGLPDKLRHRIVQQ